MYILYLSSESRRKYVSIVRKWIMMLDYSKVGWFSKLPTLNRVAILRFFSPAFFCILKLQYCISWYNFAYCTWNESRIQEIEKLLCLDVANCTHAKLKCYMRPLRTKAPSNKLHLFMKGLLWKWRSNLVIHFVGFMKTKVNGFLHQISSEVLQISLNLKALNSFEWFSWN